MESEFLAIANALFAFLLAMGGLYLKYQQNEQGIELAETRALMTALRSENEGLRARVSQLEAENEELLIKINDLEATREQERQAEADKKRRF